jgi:hypothetical protein
MQEKNASKNVFRCGLNRQLKWRWTWEKHLLAERIRGQNAAPQIHVLWL